jgi:hypothetical protein
MIPAPTSTTSVLAELFVVGSAIRIVRPSLRRPARHGHRADGW